MEHSDYVQLVLDPIQNKGKKRLRGLVIDAKVVALLKETEGPSDEHDVLSGVSGLKIRIVRNRPTQNALRMFLNAVRSSIARARNKRASGCMDGTGNLYYKLFSVKDRYMYIRLEVMRQHASSKGQSDVRKVAQYSNIIRWYIDNDACMCDGSYGIVKGEHVECAEERKKMSGTEGHAIFSLALGALFEEVTYPNIGANSGNGSTGQDVGGTDGVEENDDNSDDEDVALHGRCVRCKCSNYDCIEEQFDAVVETISFMLLEPISVGFYPHHTEENDAFGMFSSVAPQPTVIDESSTDSDVRDMVKKLVVESTELHKTVSLKLMGLSLCTHGGRSLDQWACTDCESMNGASIRSVSLQNSVLGGYVRNVITHGNCIVKFSRDAAAVVSTVLDTRVAEFEKYLGNLSMKMQKSSINYWKKYGSLSVDPIDSISDLGEQQPSVRGKKSLYVFPGRRRVRQDIEFDKVDRQECTENYFKGQSVTPAFLTVQCACSYPKLLGFVILKESESISAAIKGRLRLIAV